MNKAFLIALIGYIGFNSYLYSQHTSANDYYEYIKQADEQYLKNNYSKAAYLYTKAFEINNWKGSLEDRYNAACSWAMAGNHDSAFSHLEKIAIKGKYSNYIHLLIDPELEVLHIDKRWIRIINLIKENKSQLENNMNKQIITQLDSIYYYDQKYRVKVEYIEKRYGSSSPSFELYWDSINYYDSINSILITNILEKHGWLGSDIVGTYGSNTLAFVLIHSDQVLQKKYLPDFRKAVQNKKGDPGMLALLEDRYALSQGKMQVYGTQIGGSYGNYFLYKIIDPENVDQRRKAIGLNPISEYLKDFNISWNVKQYVDSVSIEEKNSSTVGSLGNKFYIAIIIAALAIVLLLYISGKKKNKIN